MKFDWSEFTESDFNEYCKKVSEGKIFDDDYISSVRVGDLCFDLVVRDRSIEEKKDFVLDYDLYVGGIDDGYSYGKNDYPYTECGGSTFESLMDNCNYKAFVEWAEFKFEDFITYSYWGRTYHLVEKANEPLNVW